MDGLPLFDWRPPRGPAVIVPFPATKRRARVDDYAAKLAAGQHNAERCLSAVKRQLRRELTDAGVSPARVDREVVAFDAAVRRRALNSGRSPMAAGVTVPRRHNRTGRSTSERFVRLPLYMVRSQASVTMSPLGRSLLIEVLALYKGDNNGFLGLSAREAGDALGCSKSSAARAFDELIEHGFIEVSRDARFDRKDRRATEWRVTLHQCDRSGVPPSKAFMRYAPPAPERISTVPNSAVDGLMGGTRATKLPLTVSSVGPS